MIAGACVATGDGLAKQVASARKHDGCEVGEATGATRTPSRTHQIASFAVGAVYLGISQFLRNSP